MIFGTILIMGVFTGVIHGTTVEEFLSPEGLKKMEELAIKSEPKANTLESQTGKTGTFFEGDIDLGNHSLEEYLAPEEGEVKQDGRQRNAMRNLLKRWKHQTVIWHVSGRYNEKETATIAAGMKHLADMTCIKFRKRTYERDYVDIQRGNGCTSQIGRQGGRQILSLGTGCATVGLVVHEFLHAIGFFHEQSRADRDKYVQVQIDDVKSGFHEAFQKYTLARIQHLGAPYDYKSIMHYGAFDFSRNGKPTIIPLVKGAIIGQRKGLSKLDALKVNALYACPFQKSVRPVPLFECKPDGPSNKSKDAQCAILVLLGQCNNWRNYRYMVAHCECLCARSAGKK